MSATNDPTITVISNEDMDLTGVALRDPVIDKQWVRCRITDLYWEQIDAKGGGKAKQLVIGLVTEEAATGNDGRPIAAGHRPPKVNIYATPTGGLTDEMIKKKVGRFQVAALGLAEPTKFGPPDQYIGRPIKAYFEAESKGDATYQRVGRWDRA